MIKVEVGEVEEDVVGVISSEDLEVVEADKEMLILLLGNTNT